jgi:perosamine synthetase
VEELKQMGIGTSVHFIPLHMHAHYQKRYGYRPGDFPNAEDAYGRCVSLPIFPGMRDFEVDRVIQAIEKVLCSHRKRISVLAD